LPTATGQRNYQAESETQFILIDTREFHKPLSEARYPAAFRDAGILEMGYPTAFRNFLT
jgi:hypothetical protein